MSAKLFTEGPWELVEVGDHFTALVPIDGERTSILTVVHEGGTPFAAVHHKDDAHLIAAAPELYESLEQVTNTLAAMEGWAGHTLDGKQRDEVRTMVKLSRNRQAKARGEQ